MENVNGAERRNPSGHGSLLSQALRGDSNGHSQHSQGAAGSMRGAASQRSSEESLRSLEFRPEGSHGAAKSMQRTGSHGNHTSPAEVLLPLRGTAHVMICQLACNLLLDPIWPFNLNMRALVFLKQSDIHCCIDSVKHSEQPLRSQWSSKEKSRAQSARSPKLGWSAKRVTAMTYCLLSEVCPHSSGWTRPHVSGLCSQVCRAAAH